MSSFAIHTIESAPRGSRETLEAVRRRFGFVPNLMGELAAAPAAVKAYATLSEVFAQTSLRPVEQQLVLASVSAANQCAYCVAAHSAGLRMAEMADAQVDAVREGRPLADPRLEAIRRFAHAVVEQRGHVDGPEMQAFLDAGYTREQVLEVLVGVAMKTLSNYTNHIAETPLDPQFQPFAWEPTAA